MANWIVNENFLRNQLDGAAVVDFDTDTLRIALITVTNVPDKTADQFWSDLEATEVSGTNYTTGGETVTSMTVTLNAGTVTVDGDNVTWVQSGGGFADARFAVFYKDTGTASTSPIIFHLDLVSAKGNVDSDLIVGATATGYTNVTTA
jgi:hypothetical protein